MTNAEEFIDKYKILENCIKAKLNLENYDSALIKLGQQPQFRHLKNELDYLREIRNILQHQPNINGEYPIEPNRELIKKIEVITAYIDNPPKAFDKCIKVNNVCSANWEDLIFPYMEKMQQNTYTHIPILKDGFVEGVFSENTLFGALIEDELVYDKNKTTFNDNLIKKYCKLENHVSEVFKFISKNSYVEDVKEIFNNSFENKERLSMIFITENGNSKEKLLGILTPWDMF